jgi:hypothetical protein
LGARLRLPVWISNSCHQTTATQSLRPSGDIPALTVIVSGWWRPAHARDSGRRRLTLFPHVAP